MSNHRGLNGKMPDRVVALVGEAIANSSQVAVAEATELSRLTIQRCSRGIGEPSLATLEKLAYHFGARVKFLRGGAPEPLDRIFEAVRMEGYTRETFNEKIVEQRGNLEEGSIEDYWGFFVEFDEPLPEGVLMYLCRVFGVNRYWVETGMEPSTILMSGGIVGAVTDSEKAIPPWLTASPNPIPRPTATCAKCGGELRLDDQGGGQQALRFWPCETCCKSDSA